MICGNASTPSATTSNERQRMESDNIASNNNKPGSRLTHTLGAASLAFLGIFALMAVFEWLRPLAGWSRIVANFAGGGFGLSAYAYLVSGGYDEMTDSAGVRAGRRRSMAAYMGFVAIALLTLAWLANLAEAALDLHGPVWLAGRRAVNVALIASVLLYLILRLALRRRPALKT
jgi:hypothetical protein